MSVPEKMQAVLFDNYGPPDVLHLGELPVPSPAPDEVLVRVRAAGINPADTGLRAGKYKLFTGSRFPKKLGLDLAGEVAQVGTGVKDFRAGDAVYTFLRVGSPGSYAQYATVSASSLAPKPKTLGFTEAAAVPVAALTALQALRVHGQLKAGQRLLVIGASGGVGTFAVQLGKLLGAHVTGVCSTRNVELVRGLGADEIIDYTQESFTSGNRSWDVIFDTVGTDYGASKKALARRGTWVTIIPSPKAFLTTALGMIPGVPPVRTFMAQPEAAQLREVAEWIDSGQLRVLLEKAYPLAEAAEAHRHSESHRARGKLVLELP